MHIIYLVEKGEDLSRKKKKGSTIKTFIDDILKTHTKRVYFVPHVSDILYLTRKLRDPEVHAWSSFPVKILLGHCSGDTSNLYMTLGNILINLRDILIHIIHTEQKNYYIKWVKTDISNGWHYADFHKAYISDDREVMDHYISLLEKRN